MKKYFLLLGAALIVGGSAPLTAQYTYPIDMPAHEVFNKMAGDYLTLKNLKYGDFFENFTETSREEEQGWWTQVYIDDKEYVWSEAHKKQLKRWTIVWAEWYRQYTVYLAELIEYREDLTGPRNTGKVVVQSAVETALDAALVLGGGTAGAAIAPWVALALAIDGVAGIYLEEKKLVLTKELKEHITQVRRWMYIIKRELDRWAYARAVCMARESGTTFPGTSIPDPSPIPSPPPTDDEEALEEGLDCSRDKVAEEAQKAHKTLRSWRQHTAELIGRTQAKRSGSGLLFSIQHGIDISAGLITGAEAEGGCVAADRK